MMTVSSVSRTPRGAWPTMPQDPRQKTSDDYDSINPDFPPPSLKPQESVRHKKKEKKWSIGGLFRRKKRVSDTDSSSPLEDEEEKKGFLERRRAARKRRNRGSKDVTDSFEHVKVNTTPQTQHVGTVDQRGFREMTNNMMVRRSQESLSKSFLESQTQGSTISLENAGKKGGKIKVKARVEANREKFKDESSSDEGNSSKNSLSSVPRRGDDTSGSKDGSLSRRSRAARTERYKKRLSRDDESLKDFYIGPPSRISRSDERLSNKNKSVEKTPANNRWTAKVVYYESSDYETKYTAKTKSATPSPLQSPKTRPRNALHYTASAPPASNYVTYPPSHAREGVAGSHQELRSQPFPSPQVHQKLGQKYSNMTPPRLPKSSSEMISQTPMLSSAQRQHLFWEQEALNRKSASYDHVNSLHHGSNCISKPHPQDENVLVVQFPILKPGRKPDNNSKSPIVSPQKHFTKQQNPPPPPPRDPNRRLLPTTGYHESSSRPMSYAFEDKSPQQFRYPTFTEFGSSLSAFQRVPQTNPVDLHTLSAINISNRSSSDQQIPNHINSVKMSPPMPRRPSSAQQELTSRHYPTSVEHIASSLPSDSSQSIPQHYNFYTDQQPRSRKPIHIPFQEQASSNDPYLSDSQAMKSLVQQSPRARPSAVQSATEFWKQKDQENSKKVHISDGSPKLVQRHMINTNGSNEILGPNNHFTTGSPKTPKIKLPPLMMPGRGTDSSGSVSSQSSPRDVLSPRTPSDRRLVHNEIGIPVFDDTDCNAGPKREFRPLSMLEEKTETSEQEISPMREKLTNDIHLPNRKDSRPIAVTNLDHFHIYNDVNVLKESRRKSNNLEEALNELEAIYKSLKTGEEEHSDKIAQQKSLYDSNRLDPSNWNAWVQSRGFESDSSFNYSRSSLESVDSVDSPTKRSFKLKKSVAVPDRVADDMAFRKLNKKDKFQPHEHEVISQVGSFLLVSPTLSPPPLKETFKEFIPSPPVKNEPDITLDDVVYRNIKHVNNTLKVLDPQPPFGIPLGPITPAPNSDYLHVTPRETYRPTFKPRKTPDVVSDDLAFRNLRKDSNKEPQFSPEDTTLISVPSLKKKRAVRSLSANLLSIMQKEPVAFRNNNNIIYNNNSVHNDLEKSQSYSDLINNLNMNDSSTKGQFIENKKHNMLNLKKLNGEDLDVTPRASRQFSTGTSSPLLTTSTETLTESRTNLANQEPKPTNQKVYKSSSPRLALTPERTHTSDSINPFKRSTDSPNIHVPIRIEPLKTSFIDQPKPKLPAFQRSLTPSSSTITDQTNKQENKLPISNDLPESDLLTVLAREAKEASELLSKELNDLDLDEKAKPITPKHSDTNTTQKNIKEEMKQLRENNGHNSLTKPLPIGKIIPHKPVKLNTFKITEDNRLENQQTEVTNEPIEIEGSKSMTDLLKELTKSLEFDFDMKDTCSQNYSMKSKKEEDGAEPETDRTDETDDADETTEPDIFSEAIEPRERKECEESYFSSLEEVPSKNLSSSSELSLLRTLTEISPEVQEERVLTVSPMMNSFPLVFPDDSFNEELRLNASECPTSQQFEDLLVDKSSKTDGTSGSNCCGGPDPRDSRLPGSPKNSRASFSDSKVSGSPKTSRASFSDSKVSGSPKSFTPPGSSKNSSSSWIPGSPKSSRMPEPSTENQDSTLAEPPREPRSVGCSSMSPDCHVACSNMTDEGKIRLKGCVSQWTNYLCQP